MLHTPCSFLNTHVLAPLSSTACLLYLSVLRVYASLSGERYSALDITRPSEFQYEIINNSTYSSGHSQKGIRALVSVLPVSALFHMLKIEACLDFRSISDC